MFLPPSTHTSVCVYVSIRPFPPDCSLPYPLQSQWPLPCTLALLGCQLSHADTASFLHTSYQLQDQATTGSAKPAMIQLVAEWEKRYVWHPMYKLVSLYRKLDKNLPKKKKKKRDTSLLPNASHPVLTSDITSDFHYKKIKKVWPCRRDTLFERKRACYLSRCVQLGLCSPSFWKQIAL